MEDILTPPLATDRWMLSYADVLTLLFTLFVVLFAAGRTAVKPSIDPNPPAKANPPSPEFARLQALLNEQLRGSLATGKFEISLETRGLVLQLHDASFFLSGDDQIRPECFATLGQIAEAIMPLPNPVSIEGHADGAPLHGSRFGDNWELSAARGLSVIRYLTHMLGVPPERLSAAAYADTRPRAANDSEAGRAKNRRVDIVIHHMDGAVSAPASQAARGVSAAASPL